MTYDGGVTESGRNAARESLSPARTPVFDANLTFVSLRLAKPDRRKWENAQNPGIGRNMVSPPFFIHSFQFNSSKKSRTYERRAQELMRYYARYRARNSVAGC